MDRRSFLTTGAIAAGLAAVPAISAGTPWPSPSDKGFKPIPKRPLGRTGRDLSIIGLGGIVVMNADQAVANNTVAQAHAAGINYVDVAPSYGDAQQLLGPALKPWRDDFFLACKTSKRDQAGAAAALDDSLRLLETDHLDLYQHHAVTTLEDVNRIMGPGGAQEAFEAGRKAGKIRYLGFSAHSEEAALALLDHFDFDTVLFPINFVLASQKNFGPRVIARVHEKGAGMLAIKAMAKSQWPAGMQQAQKPNPKEWYEPCSVPEQAALALRWTLSQRITAALPPGDERFFPLAMYVAQNFQPITSDEEKHLIATAAGATPIFPQA
ncbi:MAG TPA: aldo/keto reductase [Acidobacteriaceae bacterium]|jgi:aryl-alcohol dehydrogenase-like predicted oxidoreductase|nr:aldo/keto reductase [Acidobacteriaceae bacterium]